MDLKYILQCLEPLSGTKVGKGNFMLPAVRYLILASPCEKLVNLGKSKLHILEQARWPSTQCPEYTGTLLDWIITAQPSMIA